MSMIYEQRFSDSSYIETVTHGRTVSEGSPTRPAEINWHMVLWRQHGDVQLLVVGPWTTAGVVTYTADAELLWIKFKLGAFLPHLPTKDFVDVETTLPEASSQSFWLKDSAWQFPNHENVEAFVNRLVREEILVFDPIINASLQNQLQPEQMAARTLRHRFLRATGLTQTHIRQFQRAQGAARLLEQGTPILDVVEGLGYYDQPHLTRMLKRFTGKTPAQHRPTVD